MQAAASPTCLKRRSQREAFVEVSSARPVNQLATSRLDAIFQPSRKWCVRTALGLRGVKGEEEEENTKEKQE